MAAGISPVNIDWPEPEIRDVVCPCSGAARLIGQKPFSRSLPVRADLLCLSLLDCLLVTVSRACHIRPRQHDQRDQNKCRQRRSWAFGLRTRWTPRTTYPLPARLLPILFALALTRLEMIGLGFVWLNHRPVFFPVWE